MANAVYDKFKDLILEAGVGEAALDLSAATLKVALIDTATYTFSQTHEHHDDLSGIVGTPEAITSITHLDGTLDGADPTFSSLSGNEFEALVVYVDTGTSATSPLVCYIDTGVTGLPFNPSGSDVTIEWDAAGIFDL